MYKGFVSSLKKDLDGHFGYPAIEPVRPAQDALLVNAAMFVRLVVSDAAEAGSTNFQIAATAHVAQRGDVIRITSGTYSGRETKVVKTAADIIYIADDIAIANLVTFDILRHKHPLVGTDGTIPVSAVLAQAPIMYDLNGVDTEVHEDTVPANSRPLPVKVLNAAGTVPDFATQTTLAAILAKILTAPATEAKQDVGNTSLSTIAGKDFATQVTLAAVLAKIIAAPATEAKQDTGNTSLSTIAGKDFATQTTLAAVLAKIIAAPATEAKQDVGNTSLSTIAGKDFATQTTLAAVLAKIIAAPATEAKQDTQITNLGGVTEAAPASDTASSGLNGRLQRIAQRLTSLIALVPTSLGQKTMANSFAVVLASDQGNIPTSPAGYSYADSATKESGTITNGAWVQLIASTAAAAKGLTIFDSSGYGIEIGTGAAASESRKLIVPPGGHSGFIPLAIPAGTRVSARAISTTADYTAAQLYLTLLG